MNKNMNVPKLRFSEFSGEWEEKKLGNITTKIGSGNTPSGGEKVYTAEGVLFIRSQNVNNDKLELSDKTFIPIEIHNKMKSSKVSPNDVLLNITGASIGRSCVVPDNIVEANVNQHVCIVRGDNTLNSNFLQTFISSFKGQKLISQSQTGSGREGLNFQSIASFKLDLPDIKEQKKIASFLTSVDTKIEQLTKKESLLQEYKKGVMSKIFNQEIRFKNDDGSEFPEWEEKNLNELMYEHKEKNYEKKYNKNDVLSVSGSHGIVNQIEFQGRSFAGVSVDNYHIVKVDDIVYTKSPLKANPYGIIKTNKYKDGIVSTLYAVYRPKKCLFPQYINYYFEINDNVNKYLRPLVHKGAKNDMKINNQHVLSSYISIPEKKEQTKIANFLSSIDKKIELTTKELNSTKEFKKALLQQMFV